MKKIGFLAILLISTLAAKAQTLTFVNHLSCDVNIEAKFQNTCGVGNPVYPTIGFTVRAGSSLTLNPATMSPSSWTSGAPSGAGTWIYSGIWDACLSSPGCAVEDACFGTTQTNSFLYQCGGPCVGYSPTCTWTGSGSSSATVTIN